MQFVDEFRNPDIARRLIDDISRISHRMADRLGRPVQVMEVCGGHTHTIFRYGLAGMLPSSVEFVHGPGCPVCVLPIGRVDDCVAIAHQPGVILATFGDAARVPGSRYSLLEAKAAGADVRIVYSPLDALQLARANPDREVVFFALGFETTMPSTALTVLQARSEGLHNFSLFCNHITIVPTLRALLDDDQLLIDGFLGPGHVSVIIGCRPYEFIAEQYRKPMVVAGFEPLDILQSLHMVLVQLDESRAQASLSLTPSKNSAFPVHARPSLKAANAAMSFGGGSSRRSAPPLAPRVHRKPRSVPSWSRPRGPARLTTSMAGCLSSKTS